MVMAEKELLLNCTVTVRKKREHDREVANTLSVPNSKLQEMTVQTITQTYFLNIIRAGLFAAAALYLPATFLAALRDL